MPDLSAITSWPAAIVALAVLALQIPQLLSTIRTHRDTKVIREHTENSHSDADHPNMRDELTATRVAAETAAEAAQAALAMATGTKAALADHVEQADSWQTVVESELAVMHRPWWRR